MTKTVWFVLRLVAVWSAAICVAGSRPAFAQMVPALQIALGDPDRAQRGRDYHQHLLIKRPQYALDYDNELHFPDWVAWHLSAQDIGNVGRGVFTPDPEVLKAHYVMVTPAEYNRSGYDRGHNCPSADRSANEGDNNQVFLMTNITPQAHGLNAGPWEKLERYCRQLAKAGNDLFIYCGHGFSAPTHGTIGADKIAVPDFGWKVVVVVPPAPAGMPDFPDKSNLLNRITATTRVIAVKMPNINTVSKKDWREYRVSVGEIEKATGLVFFDALPRNVAAGMKDRVDFDRSAPSRVPNRSAPAPVAGSDAGGSSPPSGTATPASPADVWVNTRSGVYWRPGTRYYGTTKQGQYMSERDAIKGGYRAAGGQ